MRQLNHNEKSGFSGGSRWTKIRDKGVEFLNKAGVPVEKIGKEINRVADQIDKENARSTERGMNLLDEKNRKN